MRVLHAGGELGVDSAIALQELVQRSQEPLEAVPVEGETHAVRLHGGGLEVWNLGEDAGGTRGVLDEG